MISPRSTQSILSRTVEVLLGALLGLANASPLLATPAGSLGSAVARITAGTSTTLSGGRILFVGAESAHAEIIDPATGRSTETGRVTSPRSEHSALLLFDGRVLIAGGVDQKGRILDSAEIFDPADLKFSLAESPMLSARVRPVLFQLPDGKVQVIGGDADFTMEIYNTEGNYFTARAHLRPPVDSAVQTALIAARTSGPVTLAEQVLLVACGATVTTDKTDYTPGQTVVITGTGWNPGDTVTLDIHPDPQTHPDVILTALVGNDGTFTNSDYVIQDSDLEVSFLLTATSSNGSCIATTTFTDSITVRIRASTGVTFTLTYELFTIPGACPASFTSPSTATITDSSGVDVVVDASHKLRLSAPTTPTSPGGFSFINWTIPGGKFSATNPFCANGAGATATRLYTANYASGCSADAGPDQLNVCGKTATLAANTPPAGFTGTWSFNSGSGNFSDATDPLATVSNLSTGTSVVQWTVTDGASTTCSNTMTITTETTLPVIDCHGDINVNTDAGVCTATVDLTGHATATDNCPGTVAISYDKSSPFPKGSTLVTATATDTSGNQQTCTFHVVVSDNEKPVIDTCAVDQDVTADATCSGTVPDLTPQIVAHDNCTASGSLVVTQNPTVGTALVLNTPTVVTITVKDAALNPQTCTATVTLKDKTKPVIDTCAVDQDVDADSNCQGTIPNLLPQIVAHDNCTASGSLTITQSPTAGTKEGLGPTIVTITVEDASLNKQTCTATVTVKDTTKPIIDTCAVDQDVTADSGCAGGVPDLTTQIVAHDNCTASGSFVITQNPLKNTPLVLNVPTLVTITVADAAGNKQTCTANVTLKDKTKPSIDCHGDVNVYADPGTCQKSVTLTGHATASDNCDPSPTVGYSLGATHTYSFGSTQVTATATDVSLNAQTCNFNVNVLATPTATVLTQPATTQYSDQVTFTATVTNTINNAAVPVGSVSFVIGGSTVGSASVNASGVATITVALVEPNAAQADLSPLSPGTHTVTATYSGDVGTCYAGSGDSKTLTITKEDATLLSIIDPFVPTGGSSANVNLTAQVTQAADGFPGVLTNAWVTFKLYNSSNISMLVPDLTFGAQADATGLAQTNALLTIDTWTVITTFDDTKSFYDGPDADPVFVTVFQPTTSGQFVTGGGWIIDTAGVSTVSSLGGILKGITSTLPVAAPNSHGNFGFNVKVLKSGTLQGQSLYFFRGTNGFNYIVKSTNWQGGGLAFAGNKASFGGKCSVRIIDPGSGKAVGGFVNGRFRVDVTDNGTPGVNDSYAISVYDPSNVLYHQAGTPGSQIPLGAGNILIHIK